ncbi:MAG: hypothetical protein ACFFDN_00255 [Candidatus Hodarchaeota archaeon]
MEKIILKTADLGELEKSITKLKESYENFKKNLEVIKTYFYKNARYREIDDKNALFFMDLEKEKEAK